MKLKSGYNYTNDTSKTYNTLFIKLRLNLIIELVMFHFNVYKFYSYWFNGLPCNFNVRI